MKLDLPQANAFLSQFDYDLTTIQVFPDVPDQWPKTPGKILLSGKKGSSAFKFPGPLAAPLLVADLTSLQSQRCGVFFMVNEGDGITYSPNEICRASASVINLSACFVDTDLGDINKLLTFCKDKSVKPHFIVESSPKRFHVYFLLEPAPKTDDNLKTWQAIQQTFIEQDPGFDPRMTDEARVLRIPGFFHTKTPTPHLVKVNRQSPHPKYSLLELFELLDCKFNTQNFGIARKHYAPPHTNGDGPALGAGKMYPDMTSFLGAILNKGIDIALATDMFYAHAQRHFQSPELYLPGGAYNQKVQDFVNFKVKSLEAEQLSRSTAAALQVLDTETSPTLPDDFYYSAPGWVGPAVKEICSRSLQPYPSFAFAALTAAIGVLKAPYTRSAYRSTPPTTFSFCFARSGRGKDYPQKAVIQALHRVGLTRFVAQKFRSAQGFHRSIQNCNGLKLVMHDEAHHFFGMLRSSANDYVKQIKPMLLGLYSAHDSPAFDPGELGNKKTDTLEPIAYPCVSYCGFGVSEGLEKAFDIEALNDGIINRFIILQEDRPIAEMPDEQSESNQPFEFEGKLAELGEAFKLNMETALSGKEDPIKRVPFSRDAFLAYKAYYSKVKEFRERNPHLDVLWSRAVEIVGRYSVCLAETEITKDVVDWCIAFVDYHLSRLNQHARRVSTPGLGQELDDLVTFIAARQRSTSRPVPYRDLARGFRVRDTRALKSLLEGAVEMGEIKQLDSHRNGERGRRGTAYILADMIQ